MFSPFRSLINLIIGLLEFLLSLRFIFRLFGFAPNSGFTNWLYNFTQPFVTPFAGILPPFQFGTLFIETATVIALIIVGLIGYFLLSLAPPVTREYY